MSLSDVEIIIECRDYGQSGLVEDGDGTSFIIISVGDDGEGFITHSWLLIKQWLLMVCYSSSFMQTEVDCVIIKLGPVKNEILSRKRCRMNLHQLKFYFKLLWISRILDANACKVFTNCDSLKSLKVRLDYVYLFIDFKNQFLLVISPQQPRHFLNLFLKQES